jgi:glucose 1-dehydrogenase
MSLAGRVALITGGARGIGGATACELARRGADIAICDLSPCAAATPVIEEVRAQGRRVLYREADVADRAAVAKLVEDACAELGGIDILVNNAAFSVRKPLLELEVAEVERVWNVIQWGTFHASQLAARRMVAQGRGGSIVMISSVHAARPFALSTAYNGAKAAINHMARTWAVELAQYGIRVNAIEPGWIDTPGERAFYSQEQIREQGRKLLLGRLGRPEEIAAAVAYLVSGDAAYVTGACLRVDGGIVLPRRHAVEE